MTHPTLPFDLLLVFFIYGLAFFSLGLAMLLESSRSPLMANSRALQFLALFGFLHGLHEWLEMALRVAASLSLPYPPGLSWLRLGLLVFSFTSLIVFGLQVLRPNGARLSGKNLSLAGMWTALVILLMLGLRLVGQLPFEPWLVLSDALARYILAVPGAALAMVALQRQSRLARREDLGRLANHMLIAGLAFGIYALTQLFTSPLDLFPARLINQEVFLELAGFPIQALRAVLALVITAALIRASQYAATRRQEQLQAAQQARLQALEQVQRDLVERENLRRALLRHTVLAQEEERARLARELHDETAQFLTALNLNIAALANLAPRSPTANQLAGRLQELSQQMAQGIYRMVHGLRPAQLDDLGLVAALQYLCDELRQRSGLEVTLTIEGRRKRLDDLVETVFFRVAQEALSNTARHSGCNRAAVSLYFQPGRTSMSVCDAGTGFDPGQQLSPPHGWGLAGMRERAESVGGQLTLQSAPGHGTLVELTVPLTETTHGNHSSDAG